MNKLEVGMYVRTKTGIHKIFKIDEHKTNWKYLCDKKSTGEWDGSYEYTPLKEELIIKSSYNIIDLIEVGDYVNGVKIKEILEMKTGKIIIVSESEDYLENDDIESAVTKEQFEQMKYEV